jgi:hypothetical protein
MVIKQYKQTGIRKDIALDRLRKAKEPGRRVSISGKVYFETRKNRSDIKGTGI